MHTPIHILLADDHAVLRAGLRALLDAEPDMRVVGEAATGEEAVEQARATLPDIVLMDIGMPGIGGLEATRRIVALAQETKILVVTARPEAEFLVPVLEAGARGYLGRTDPHADLVLAIRMVARGEVFLKRAAAKLLVEHRAGAPSGMGEAALERLSVREREVLALAAAGHTSTEIAKRLDVSPKTVDSYRSRAREKLGLTNRVELVRFALRVGLLKDQA
jgi:two-component system response regulator NreC